MTVRPLQFRRAMRTLALFVLTSSLVVNAAPRLEGNTVVVDLGTRQLRFFAGCTAVSVIHATQLHVGCGDGRVRSYELDESSALLVNERQFDGRDARLALEAGAVVVRVALPDGTSSTRSLEAEPVPEPLVVVPVPVATEPPLAPMLSKEGPGAGAVVGRIAMEVLVETLMLAGAGAVGLLIILPGVLRPSGLRPDAALVFGPVSVATLASALSPLLLAPLHRRLGGKGELWHGFMAAIPSLLVAGVIVGATGPTFDQGRSLVTLALPGFASIVGLEVGHGLAAEEIVTPTLSVSSSGASVGVTGRF